MDKIYSRPRIKIFKGITKKTDNRRAKKIYYMTILIVIVILTIYHILSSIDPIFEGLCIAKAQGIATEITNKKTSDVLVNYNYNDIVELSKNENQDNILKTDVALINKIASDIALEIQAELEKIEKKDIEIPMGALIGNQYFAGMGPNIKIKIISVGDIKTEMKTEFKSAGINQTMHRIYLEIECNISILTSYKTINRAIKNQVLLVETVIVGDVPETYLNLDE